MAMIASLGIPIDYDSETYTYSAQLEELRTLCIGDHKSDSSDALEDDAPTLTNHIDKFDSDHSHSLSPIMSSLSNLSDLDQTHRSSTDSILDHLKYDRMEPLMLGAQSPRRDSNDIRTERRDSITSQPPIPFVNNGYCNTALSSAPTSPRTDIISSKLMHLNQIQLPHATDADIIRHNDDEKDGHAEDINDDKIRDLMNDIWWFFDSDKEFKKNEELKKNMLILFKSFNLMRNSGSDVYFALCKLLSPQLIAYAKSEASRCLDSKLFEPAITAYNVLIRFCADASYYLQRSECHFKLNHYEEALRDAKESCDADVGFEKGYLMHGKVLMALSQYDEAKALYVCGYNLNGKYQNKFAIGLQCATKHIQMRKESKQMDIAHLELGSDAAAKTEEEDEEVKYKRMSVITSEMNTKRIKWNDMMRNMQQKECRDDDISQCLSAQRVIFWLRMYFEWNERYLLYLSFSALIASYPYDAGCLYNDYIHVVEKHLDSCSNCKLFGVCQDMQCTIQKRHCSSTKYTHSMAERKRRYKGYVRSDDICLMQLLDQIHCGFMHFDAFCFDYTLSEIHSLLKRGKAKKKFILKMPLSLGTQQQQFVYWPCFEKSSLYCAAKYETLKDELLENKIYKMNELVWNDVLMKAQWIQQSMAAKAKDRGVENERLGIGVGCDISLRHIVVLLVYCNCVELRHAFVAEKKRMDLQSEIALFCRFLYEAILFYGSEMTANEYFYGAICSDDDHVLFNEYSLCFKQAVSMTSSLNVMVKVAKEKMANTKNKQLIIVKYGASDSYGCCYFNLQMFSDDPQQKEVVFFNCKLSIYDVLHFDVNYGDESKQILQSNDKYVESLILFEKMVNGHFFSSQYDTRRQHLYEKIVTKMILNHLHPVAPVVVTKEKIEIPPYIQKLFTYFCDEKNEIWLIKSELSSLSDALRMHFIANDRMDSSNRDCYGPFLQMMETNHRERAQTFVNFVSEYVWYIAFHQFLALQCNQSMTGPKLHVQISDDSFDYVVFQPNCYRSLNNAPSFGAFGLQIKQLPESIEKIKFEYQVTCKESKYILLVPSTNKWYSTGDNICFKSFKSQVLTSRLVKNRNEFSYRFTIKIVQIHKTDS
eukprot:616274_1